MDLSASFEHPDTSHVFVPLFSAMSSLLLRNDIFFSCEFVFLNGIQRIISDDIIHVNMTKVSPSMLSADFSRLGDELKRVEGAGADMIHIDVMDGMFVPNITIGPLVVKALRPLSKMPFDVHLMIEDPIRYVEDFAKAGADVITIHAESKGRTMRAIEKIRSLGKSPGISINPGTPFSKIKKFMDRIDVLLIMTVQPGFGGQAFREECVTKISEARRYIDENHLNVEISIDGGINRETGKRCVDAGADILAAGSSLFSLKDMKSEIDIWRSFGP